MACSVGSPASSQATSVSAATTSTAGTNTAATLSTSFWIGGLAACASSTSRMMWASTPSPAVALTCSCSRPPPLSVPPVTLSPGPTSTGSGSPVSMLASIWLRPSTTWASAGTRSPGRNITRSPTSSSETGTSCSPSKGDSQCATSGRSACSAAMACEVWRRARISSHLPSCTSVMTTAALSKYTCGAPCAAAWRASAERPWRHHSHSDSPHAAVVPMATSSSMLPVRCLSACQAPR